MRKPELVSFEIDGYEMAVRLAGDRDGSSLPRAPRDAVRLVPGEVMRRETD
jgi:hypothetical protein